MAENTTNYQCPACTGPLRFDSASGKLCCDYCGSTYDVAQVEALYGEKQAQADKAAEAAEKAASSGPVWGEMETGDLSSRTCTSCGAELVCGPETAATTCPYCGNPTVLGGQLSGKLKPEYIIPFRMDKKTAIENLKKYYKGKVFLPKAFKESNHIEEIQGVYVPFWLYDGRMEARGAYKAEISESHREGDYVVGAARAQEGKEVLTITEKGYGKKTPVEEYRITNRGGLGIKNYMVTEKTGGIVGVKVVDGSEDLLLVTRAGILIRTPVEAIRTTGRATQGVIVMRFKEEGDSVISMALTEHEEDDET